MCVQKLKHISHDSILLQFGNHQAVYDALQLSSCNVSMNSGKRYVHSPLRYNTMPDDDSIVVYADPNTGDDENPGTSSQPVKTINTAIQLMRLKRAMADGNEKGIIYLNPGYYHPTKSINLTTEDSNLAIVGSGVDSTIISGAKNYTFNWKKYAYERATYVKDISIVNDTISKPGKNTSRARFVSKMFNTSACQKACDKDPSCFAYTWFNDLSEEYSNLCYFRTDGLWVPMDISGAMSGRKLNIFVADLSGQNPTPFSTLFLNGRRAIRARYPDGNPETMGLHTTLSGYMNSAEKWLPAVSKPAAEEIHIESPQTPWSEYPAFYTGIGGPVDEFYPPKSFWGVAHPTGGTYQVPSGLVYSSDEEFASRSWENPRTGVVHAFHGFHWANWQFKIDDRDEANNVITWSYGGFQEARGQTVGQEWFIDNIFEELDAPGEWFYDETEQKLYLFPNSTDDLPSSGSGTVLQRLLNIRGTLDNPVYNITVINITFTQTEPTFLERYEVPSGGDWSIHRGGTVFVEGVDGFTIQQCLFDSPGGNALFLSNYIRNAIIEANEFKYVGDSAIAAVGSTELIDGTNGNQPRGTKIVNNLIHEIGIYGKQTSAYFQSLACQTDFDGNILFNGPRDGLNFDDNFGGGNVLKNNLAFNMVRETQDCGPFNFFDRVPYITRLFDGKTPSLMPAMSYIHNNFVVSNYHSIWPLDHDDSSCYWVDTNNFLVYGGYKNNLGHSKTTLNNTYIYPDAVHYNVEQLYVPWPYCVTDVFITSDKSSYSWGEVWANNKCVIGNPNIYFFNSCDPEQDNQDRVPVTFCNEFYAPHKDIYIQCGDKQLTLEEYKEMGFDEGSVVHDIINTSTIVAWASELFGL